jgi:hypothetical protein
MLRRSAKVNTIKRAVAIAFSALATLGVVNVDAGRADDQSRAGTTWSASPYHRAQDGNGKTIPCLCSVHGKLVPLGTRVCMQTPSGIQIAQCELAQNVTSWVPTGTACHISDVSNEKLQQQAERPPA